MAKLIVGCGYLGRRVAARWLSQGQRVFATTRSQTRADEVRALGIEPIVADVLDRARLSLPAVDTVLYCVGYDRSSGRSMREVYVDGLANVLSKLPTPGRFVYVSSTGVYGQAEGEEVDETAATEPRDESGQIVLEAERVLRACLPDAVILRFAGIYGPGRLLRRREQIERGEPLTGNPEQWLNLIHVDDGATAILAAEGLARPGATYNICDDNSVMRREFYTHLAELFAAPAPVFLPDGNAASRHTHANRRIVNRRMHDELRVTLRFPSFVEGLRAV
jgi:nucleoside-diphosphate-sugar epimerase